MENRQNRTIQILKAKTKNVDSYKKSTREENKQKARWKEKEA